MSKLKAFVILKMGEIDLGCAFNNRQLPELWGAVGFVIALTQDCSVLKPGH